ncbi:MAG: PDZ domain-containing protein [Anaplasmataceae bacterium]|nr:PDZ domain-containing protein [Anaplasmataceae bacterium]
MKHFFVVVFASLFFFQTASAYDTQSFKDEDVWETLSKEPCLKPVIETQDWDRGLLIFYLHRYHRYRYPLHYFCHRGKPESEKEIRRLLDRWSWVVSYFKKKEMTMGISYRMRNNLPYLLRVVRGSPAERAGLLRGDTILAVDGKRPFGHKQADTILSLPPGHKAKIRIRRKESTLTVFLEARVIEIPEYDLFPLADYLYLRLYAIQGADEILEALRREYLNFPYRGLILDLRGCPGGSINAAARISGWFLGFSVAYLQTVPFEGKYYRKVLTFSHDDPLLRPVLNGGPVVTLVDKNTYSASEMIASALQDHERSPLIGSKTGGKGTITTLFNWTRDRDLMLSIALWYSPKGRMIEGKGIVPNLEPFADWEVTKRFREACGDHCFLLEEKEVQTALRLLENYHFSY